MYLSYCYSFLLGINFLGSLISSPRSLVPLLGYSMLFTMYYWISTSVAIPYLFDSISCFVSYILSPLSLCFRTWLFRYLVSFAF